jgi:glycosyltransferase involved in cell wall biosynthesis
MPRAQQERLRIPPRPRPGVNLVGFLEAESGLGEAARRIANALDRRGVPTAAISHRGTERHQFVPQELKLSDEAPYDTNLVCLNPGHLAAFVEDVGAEFFANRYAVGVWFWETNRIRLDERSTTRFLDEVWVTSSYVRDAIGEAEIPVRILPVPMEAPTGPFRTRRELGLPGGFTFLFVFDLWSEERKNPAAVIEAFTRAFAPGEGPTLVLKSVHGDSKARELGRLRAMVEDREDVLFRDGYVSAVERDSFFAECVCYVSLHRSEGLGLTMAEAMALGKPVIATGYSGNLEFMDEGNSYLVPYDLVDVPSSWWAYGPGATWAEPDIEVAARLMRQAWEHPDEARALGKRGQSELLERFSPRRTADFARGRLEELRESGAIAARTRGYDARPAILDTSLAMAGDPGASLTEGHGTSALVRRFARRTLWPYFRERQRVDASLLQAVISLERSVQSLERRVLELEGAAKSATDAATRPP